MEEKENWGKKHSHTYFLTEKKIYITTTARQVKG